jgi:hypothetical protein
MQVDPSCASSEADSGEQLLELWNPIGIAVWSVFFTPAFGAWLQMYNWRRLGEHGKAAQARRWCMAALAVLAFNAIFSAFAERLGHDSPLIDWVNAALLVVWYLGTVSAHAQAIRERCGARYARRAWDSVVLLGVIAAWVYVGGSVFLRVLLVQLT